MSNRSFQQILFSVFQAIDLPVTNIFQPRGIIGQAKEKCSIIRSILTQDEPIRFNELNHTSALRQYDNGTARGVCLRRVI